MTIHPSRQPKQPGKMFAQYDATTFFVCPVYVLVIVFGSVGNAFLIHSFRKDQTIQQKPFNFLITNLAGADLLICALFTPLLLVYRANPSAAIIATTPLCEASIFLSNLAVSLMYIVFPLLALHRIDVVNRPRAPFLSISRCRQLTSLAWFFSTLAAAGFVLLAHRQLQTDDVPKLYRCIFVNTQLDGLSSAFVAFGTCLYGASLIFSAATFTASWAAQREISAEVKCMSKLSVWVCVCYTLCWAPFLVVQLLGVLGTYTEVHFNLHACSSAVGVFASAVNPALVTLIDPYYKAKARALFLTGKKDKKFE